MIINKKFNYTPLKRIDTPEGRRYIVGEDHVLPSVTTVLSATKDTSFLKDWIKKVGEEQAEKIKVEAISIGSAMHKNLEDYILGNEMTGNFMSKLLAKVIINSGFPNINEIWGSEVGLYSSGLYAGTTDLVGIHNGEPAIMDFKNSLNSKKKEWIEDYFIQCCAYSLSHNEMYNTDIKKGVIMIATRDAKYQEFIIEGNEFKIYKEKWFKRLEDYYKLQ